jgi:hypothetical protein
MFKKGDRVKVKNSLVEGKVLLGRVDDDGETLRHLVEYQDFEGIFHERWFLPTELESVGEQA